MFNLFRKKESKTRYVYETIYLADTENEEVFNKALKGEYYENPEYDYTAKELKEDYMGERVYKFAPYDLPHKIEDGWVYSYLEEGKWLKIGRVKRTDLKKLDGEVSLAIYPGIYKYVREDGIEKDERDPYFAITVKTKM